MPGFSITLLLLPDANNNTPSSDLILSLLDEPTDTPGWKWSSRSPPRTHVPKSTTQKSAALSDKIISVRALDPSGFTNAIERACNKLIDAEPDLTKMDTIAGDGDCGLTLKEGANGVLKSIKEGKIKGDDLVGSLIAIASVAEEQMGGTSGALYSFVTHLFSLMRQLIPYSLTPGSFFLL
jgi:triose/dihydroxyacetone kinase / FAD-AMP lyase (cyclizing)